MKINTIGDLKKFISHYIDEEYNDFKIEINIMTEIPKEELIKSSYPYQWSQEDGYIEYHDTGYSDKVVCFGIYKIKER